jgi:hypothetical protein
MSEKHPTYIRDREAQSKASVKVMMSCGHSKPFSERYWGSWGDSQGSGVIISDTKIVTAAHVVRCPIVPDVMVMLTSGKFYRVHVTKRFSDDIAELELSDEHERFDMRVKPPRIAKAPDRGDPLCTVTATPKFGWSCGLTDYSGDDRIVYDAFIEPGNSGSAVYDIDGYLVGIATERVNCKSDDPSACQSLARPLFGKDL